MVSGGRTVNRLINLTFKLSGVKDQQASVQQLTSSISEAMRAMRLMQLSAMAIEGSLGPLGWASLGIGVLTQAALIKSDFTSTESVNARGR